MDSPKKLSPPSTPESSPKPHEENSAGTQAVSEVLANNLSNLTLNPSPKFPSLPPKPSPQLQDEEKKSQGLGLGLGQGLLYRRRRGVKTVASVRKERLLRTLQLVRYRTQSLLKKDPEERKRELEERARRFRCSCRYCLFHGDPADDIILEKYGMGLI